jgi:hypothetical protein
MSFKNILDKHADHKVVIIPRLHKNKLDPIPGLYCAECSSLIKWLSLDSAAELLESGVEGLDMLPHEETVWRRRLRLGQMSNLKADDIL